MALEAIPSPYVGLRPFREEDAPFFFGRERDTRVISSNLLQERLTILYGPSGAGKSSVLQAGVVPHLRSIPSSAVVYFRNWQTKSFLADLTASCAAAVSHGQDDQRAIADLEQLALGQGCEIFFLLDQFEEYLLYHSGDNPDRSYAEGQVGSAADGIAKSFDGILARLINRHDITSHVLIGLREDALSKLIQRFSIRIPDLLGNTLEVARLDKLAATEAIKKPLEVFNKTPFA